MLLNLIEKNDRDRAVFVVEVPGISMTMSNWSAGWAPPQWGQVVDGVEGMLRNEQINDPVVLVGHSYGGLYLSVVLKTLPNLVKGAVLLEPACMLCHYPKVNCSVFIDIH